MTVIHVIGLGPGDEASVPVGTMQLLKSGLPLYFRTFIHPIVDELLQEGMSAESFDSVYDQWEHFEEVYSQMAENLLKAAEKRGDIVYAVPGHPLMAEQAVQILLAEAPKRGLDVRIGPGHSFLDSVCALLHIDPIDGMTILDGTKFELARFSPSLHTLIVQVFSREVASEIKLSLMEVLPDDYEVKVVRAAGVPNLEEVASVPLYDLDRVEWIDHLTTVYIPKSDESTILRTEAWFVADLVRQLREPNGCPWDREQTHTSLRPYVIEEAYEVAEAIDSEDEWELASELGDLLLQVLLHSQIAAEEGTFTIRDVYAELSDKLIRRHPHVFGEIDARSVDEAQAAWQAAKAAEKSTPGVSVLDGVKWKQPAIAASLSVQERAAKVGFDWDSVDGIMDKVREELDELMEAVSGETEQPDTDGAFPSRGIADAVHDFAEGSVREEYGDLLLSVVNLGRKLHLDVEQALSLSNRKFARRFMRLEKFLKKNGQDFQNVTAKQLDDYWNEIKVEEKSLPSNS